MPKPSVNIHQLEYMNVDRDTAFPKIGFPILYFTDNIWTDHQLRKNSVENMAGNGV